MEKLYPYMGSFLLISSKTIKRNKYIITCPQHDNLEIVDKRIKYCNLCGSKLEKKSIEEFCDLFIDDTDIFDFFRNNKINYHTYKNFYIRRLYNDNSELCYIIIYEDKYNLCLYDPYEYEYNMNCIASKDVNQEISKLKTKHKKIIDLFNKNKIKCVVEFGYFSIWH